MESDLSIESALEEGANIATEEIYSRLAEAGVPEELLFDPAPKRGRSKKPRSGATGRFARPWHHKRGGFRYMDPASRLEKARSYARKAKDPFKKAMVQIGPYVMPLAAVGAFYAEYTERADELLAAGKITKADVMDAVTYDAKHFDAAAIPERLKAHIGTFAGLIGGGWVLKNFRLLGPYSGLVANVLIGGAVGIAAKDILDPPIPKNTSTATQGTQVPFNPLNSMAGVGVPSVLPGIPVGRAF